jgi:hypothetical protein
MRCYKRHMKALYLLSLSGALALAQAPTGVISCVVTDPSGSAVTSGKITAVHRDTGLSRTDLTSSEGACVVPALLAGIYDIKVPMDRTEE